MSTANFPEPWLRGTLTDVSPIQRAILHALELAKEDLERWCGLLSDEELNATPYDGVAPVAFHLRHIARSLDRLLTYAEGKQLDAVQMAALKSELESGARTHELFSELHMALDVSATRVRSFRMEQIGDPRKVGKKGIAHDGRRTSSSCSRSHAAPCRSGDNDCKNLDCTSINQPINRVELMLYQDIVSES